MSKTEGNEMAENKRKGHGYPATDSDMARRAAMQTVELLGQITSPYERAIVTSYIALNLNLSHMNNDLDRIVILLQDREASQ